MRDLNTAVVTHLQSRKGVIPRDFVWITAKDRNTGTPESTGFWNGDDTVTLDVISGLSGLPETRTYIGWGDLGKVDSIPLVSDLTIRTINISVSHLSAAVQQMIRGYDVRLAPVEVHRGFFDLDTRNIIAAPRPRFLGYVNGAGIETPPVGGEGAARLAVVSHTRALTKTNSAKRSDETQKRRSGDRFRRYSDVAGQWTFFWGEKKGKLK